LDFPRTDKEEDEYIKEQRRDKDLIKCVKRRDYFIQNENKMGNCTYHDGFVYDNSSLELTKYTPTDASDSLNRDEFQLINNPENKDDIERRKGRFKYICCDTTVQGSQGSSSGGCKKGKHGFAKLSNKIKCLRKILLINGNNSGVGRFVPLFHSEHPMS
jgi:hypothetical protein